MRSFWSDPYLWIHLAGAAVLPITLELCLLGLAIGDPIFPPVVERLVVLTVGIVPIFLMQWQRPFYIFSVLFVAVKPEYLTIDQRRILKRFKTLGHQVLTVLVAIGLGAILLQLYRIAPLVLEPAAQFPQWRGLGLLIAAGGFLLSNLFLQVSLSVLRVMLTGETNFATIEPYAIDQIRSNFSIFGWRVRQIVPPLTEAQTLAMAAAVAAAPAVSPVSPVVSPISPTSIVTSNPIAAPVTEAEAIAPATESIELPLEEIAVEAANESVQTDQLAMAESVAEPEAASAEAVLVESSAESNSPAEIDDADGIASSIESATQSEDQPKDEPTV